MYKCRVKSIGDMWFIHCMEAFLILESPLLQVSLIVVVVESLFSNL